MIATSPFHGSLDVPKKHIQRLPLLHGLSHEVVGYASGCCLVVTIHWARGATVPHYLGLAILE